MNTKVTVAFLNFVTDKSVQNNIDQVLTLMEQAKEKGAKWVFLPELWTHQSASLDEFRTLSKQADQIVLTQVQKACQMHQLVCFAGSWTETSTHPDKFYNTQYVIDEKGEVISKYRKVHLFKMDDGSPDPYRETKKFVPGESAVTCQVDSWKVSLSTCFDIRFPEYYIACAKEGPVDVITVPSAFIQRTGRDHWEVLLRARAIENQAYVIASNRLGAHEDPRIKAYFGHSMVIDPWGTVLLDTKDELGVFTATIDLQRISEVRTLLPLMKVKQYKKDIY
ncbi:MAG: hypothetical protein KDD46_05405 [Bdellovibrionales bacterium]|nr:hypothetical protein [Bdellovibrionales bacterium]